MNVTPARNEIKQLAKIARHLVALDEELEKIGSLDQARSETDARLAELRAQEDTIGQSVADARKAVVDARAEAARAIEQAHDRAQEIHKEAEASAAGIVSAAEERAREAAAAANDQIKAQETAAHARLATLDVKAREADDFLHSLRAKTALKQAELDKLNSQLEEAERKRAELRRAIS